MNVSNSPFSALYVDVDGPYPSLTDDWWDVERDARLYRGPRPVIAHPPCGRWGRYWGGGPSARSPRLMGDDEGCFAAALWAVRTFGGVLEHPEGSHAFRWHGLPRPRVVNGFHTAVVDSEPWPAGDAWSVSVDQSHYGHRARKRTWLYCVGVPLRLRSSIVQSVGQGSRLDQGYHSAAERAQAVADGTHRPTANRLTAKENQLTPQPFASLLVNLVGAI